MQPICPICSSDAVKNRGIDKLNAGNSLFVCLKCGLGFYDKKAFSESSHEQLTYNEESFFGRPDSESMPEWFQHTEHFCEPGAAWHVEKFKQYTPGPRFLDLGCGLGGFLHYVKSHTDFECHGTDISPKACAYVTRKQGIPTRSGPFNASLFADVKFDMIFLSDVIEHIPDPHVFVNHILAACSPGAIVGVACPNDASLTAIVKRVFFYPLSLNHEYGYLCWPFHLFGYTPCSLEILFKSKGFIPKYSTAWSKSSRLHGSPLKRSEWLLYPVYLAEQAFNRGSKLIAYFQAPGLNTPGTPQ